MNIFYTDADPIVCAEHHCRRHVVKMILEGCQMLSAAHHLMGGLTEGIYKKTHHNHPSSVWVRQSSEHYEWLWLCTKRLCEIYTETSGKRHKSEDVLDTLVVMPESLTDNGFIEPPACVSDSVKLLDLDAIQAYRAYLNEKFKEWLGRERPLAIEFNIKPEWVMV